MSDLFKEKKEPVKKAGGKKDNQTQELATDLPWNA